MTALLYRFRLAPRVRGCVLGTLLIASLNCLCTALRYVGFGFICAWEDIRKYVRGAVEAFGSMWAYGLAAFRKGSKL